MKATLLGAGFCWLICLFQPLFATHIVGSDLIYTPVDTVNHRYRVQLTLYRDCTPAALADFDQVITLFFWNGATGAQEFMIDIPKTFVPTPIAVPNADACLTRSQINGFCAEFGSYIDTVTLPPIPGGYDITWTRCCRSNAITNLIPQEGSTWLAHVPTDITANNSSPVFRQLLPMFLCAGQPFVFDHSATDIEGDSLVYRITNPFSGVNQTGIGTSAFQPTVNQVSQMGAPPYNNVTYIGNYSYLDPFGSRDFRVDHSSGLLTVTPAAPGLFVFAVSVFEYRNGILLSENKRDFQIHVLNCVAQGTPPQISSDLTKLPQFSNDSVFVRHDTIMVQPARPFCYPAILTDPDPSDTVIMFPVSSWFGVGGSANPPYASLSQTGINPAYGDICWTPGCELAGQWVDMVVGGYDPHDCLGYNVVFDTVRIKILGANPPVLRHQLPNGGDTAWVRAGEDFCYAFTAKDIDPFDGLIVTPTGGPFAGLGGTAVKQDTGVNPVKGTVCWTPQCEHKGQTFVFELTAVDTNYCNKSHPVTDRVVVIVEGEKPLSLPDTVKACKGSDVKLTAQHPGNGSFHWSPGASLDDSTSLEPVLLAQQSGRFFLNYTDPENCSQRDSLWLEVLPLPEVSVFPDSATICPGDSVLLEAVCATMISVKWGESFFLSNHTKAKTWALPPHSQAFTATATDANGCQASGESWIEVLPPAAIDAGEDIRHCDILPLQLGASGGVSYHWEPATYLQGANSPSPLANPGVSMDYVVTGLNAEGCRGRDTVSVIRVEPPQTVIDVNYLPCDRQSRVELRVMGGDSLIWNDGSTERYRSMALSGPLRLSARIFDGLCEGLPDSVLLEPNASFPVADFTFSPDSGIAPIEVQFVNLSTKAVRFDWDFGRGYFESNKENPVHTFTAGEWQVMLIAWSEEGCPDTVTQKLYFERPSLYIPSAFSPNGDGCNDDFYVGSYGLSRFDFRVFTRWGTEIFHSTDPAFHWTATTKAKMYPKVCMCTNW
ncbi:MAG: gliding motility-associated C-terminal domain-containing protein [Bacteroidia bacterium]